MFTVVNWKPQRTHFWTTSKTSVTSHVIDTGDASPVRVPSCSIPSHYVETLHRQSNDHEMASNSIIQWSSPWCAPAVYFPKSNGEMSICVDFVQLNQVSKKELLLCSYHRGPQQKLAGKHAFSKLDLCSAYWQFPMQEQSIEKTAFCLKLG